MVDSNYRIILDVQDMSASIIVAAKKGETGRKIYISLLDGGLPYEISPDCYAVLTGQKPDGNVLYNHCDIDGNGIIYTFTEQTTAFVGMILCSLNLYGADDKLLISPKFRIIIDGTIYEDDVVESQPEFSALTQLISDATTVIEQKPILEQMAQEAKESAAQAAESEEQAMNSATAAATSETNAAASQEAAASSASTASVKAGEAVAAAETATGKATAAASSAASAAASEISASESQEAAAASASTASSKAVEATTAAETSTGKAMSLSRLIPQTAFRIVTSRWKASLA